MTPKMSVSSIAFFLMEGVWSIRGHMGLGSRVVTCARACATLQPSPYVRVNPAACGAVEEDARGAHEVPGK